MLRVVIALALSASLSAQLTPGVHHWIKDTALQGFVDLEGNSFGRTCELELSGDLRPDVLVMVGDQVWCFVSPGVYESVIDLQTTANDVCPLPDRGPQGRDAFVMCGVRPLETWWIDPATHQFGNATVGSAAWIGAVELQVADVTGDGEPDALGVSADRETILRRSGPLATGVEEYLDLDMTIHRMVPIEWDGSSGEELALLTSEGLLVVELSGALLFGLPTDGDDSDRFCVVHVDGSPLERLATLLFAPGDGYYLYARDKNRADTPTWLGEFAPVAISSGYRDADGLQDVCISQNTNGYLAYFENRFVGGAAFNGTHHALWDPTLDLNGWVPVAEVQAHVLLSDLDRDGDGDVFFPVEAESAVNLLKNDLFDPLDRAPRLDGATYEYNLSTDTGMLELTLSGPVEPPIQNDRLKVIAWRQPGHYHSATESVPHYSTSIVLSQPAQWPLTISIPVQQAWLESEGALDGTLVHVELRLGEYQDEELISAAPAAVWSFTADLASKLFLETEYHVTEFSDVEIAFVGGEESVVPPPPGGPGWTAPMPCVPCLADDPVPRGGN